MIQETDENNCDYRVNIISVLIREMDHLFEKIFTFLTEIITFFNNEMVYLLSCKGYDIYKLQKTIIVKYQSIINFILVIHFSYKNRAINQTSKARYI